MLRHGAIAGVRPMQGVDLPWIVHAMIGEGSKDHLRAEPGRFGDEGFAPKTSPCPAPRRRLCGRSHLACHSRGRIFVNGGTLGKADVATRIARGIALIPEDASATGWCKALRSAKI